MANPHGDIMKTITIRYTAPSKYDHAEYGAVCRVVDGTTEQYYIQASKKKDITRWMKSGDFFDMVCGRKMNDPVFWESWINLNETK